MSRSKVFSRVGGIKPRRSVFDLSYDKKFTCDFGQIIPVMCDEVVPGDRFLIGGQVVARFQPLMAPIMHETNIYVYYYYVPYRILWEKWTEFITENTPKGDPLPDLPYWQPTNNNLNSLWDYLGFPVGINPVDAYPLDFPRRAYNLIWNEYFRDQFLQDEIPLDNENILNRSWEKDYFTSARPSQQQGDPMALPIQGIGHVNFNGVLPYNLPTQTAQAASGATNLQLRQSNITGASGNIYATPSPGTDVTRDVNINISAANLPIAFRDWLESNEFDFSEASTFDVNSMRRIFAIQLWKERNMRAGVRYTEFLRSHFGVSPRDDRLQRPEYIGGLKVPMIISEVLQTSTTEDNQSVRGVQGNMAGHGLAVDRKFVAKYNVYEYGLIMGLMSIMPRSAYQQGINAQWRRDTMEDFFMPEFVNLGEQAVRQAELMATNDPVENKRVFGYQGRYNEMRYKPNMVCGELREVFKYWHLGRIFDPATPPRLNSSFIQCDSQTGGAANPLKRVFAVGNVPGIIVTFGNIIKAIRPLPYLAEPGLIDHS